MSKTIDTPLLGIFVLIIANFILLCLFLLSTPVANFLITLIKHLIIVISARRYRADSQDIMDKVKTKAKDRQIVYKLLESKRTEFASMEFFVLIIVNFILLWLFPLSTIVANLLIALRQKSNNGHPEGSNTGGPPGN